MQLSIEEFERMFSPISFGDTLWTDDFEAAKHQAQYMASWWGGDWRGYIWTVVENDDGNGATLCQGNRIVNTVAYVVTRRSCKEFYSYFDVSVPGWIEAQPLWAVVWHPADDAPRVAWVNAWHESDALDEAMDGPILEYLNGTLGEDTPKTGDHFHIDCISEVPL